MKHCTCIIFIRTTSSLAGSVPTNLACVTASAMFSMASAAASWLASVNKQDTHETHSYFLTEDSNYQTMTFSLISVIAKHFEKCCGNTCLYNGNVMFAYHAALLDWIRFPQMDKTMYTGQDCIERNLLSSIHRYLPVAYPGWFYVFYYVTFMGPFYE